MLISYVCSCCCLVDATISTDYHVLFKSGYTIYPYSLLFYRWFPTNIRSSSFRPMFLIPCHVVPWHTLFLYFLFNIPYYYFNIVNVWRNRLKQRIISFCSVNLSVFKTRTLAYTVQIERAIESSTLSAYNNEKMQNVIIKAKTIDCWVAVQYFFLHTAYEPSKQTTLFGKKIRMK